MTNHRSKDQSFYEILEVREGANDQEIHEAYNRAKRTYSPDSPALYTMFSPDEARELLRLVEEAYRTLSNRARRHQYDQTLHQYTSRRAVSGDDLPDFEIVEDFVVRGDGEPRGEPHYQARATPPRGFRKTKFSVYKINEDFEHEITVCEEFSGNMLQRIRSYKEISIEQLSIETKVSKTYLRALEEDRYSDLPAPVFVRGFVVQVARALGLDEQKAANSYMNLYKANATSQP